MKLVSMGKTKVVAAETPAALNPGIIPTQNVYNHTNTHQIPGSVPILPGTANKKRGKVIPMCKQKEKSRRSFKGVAGLEG